MMIKKYIGPSELHNARCWQHSHVCYQLNFTIRTLLFLLAFASTYSHCRALIGSLNAVGLVEARLLLVRGV